VSAATSWPLDSDLAVTGLVAGTIPFSNVDGPGNRFTVFLQGCNFDCAACHNPQTIHRFPPDAEPPGMRRSVGEVLSEVRRAAPFLSGVTVSGGEATEQPDFVAALFAAIHAEPRLTRLTRFVDSNGAAAGDVWERLAPLTDGAMIDLKCLDPEIHRRLTGHGNEAVLASIEQLHGLGLLYEVRLLLVAGVNDGPALLRRTAEWLAAIEPRMRLELIAFRRHGVRVCHPPLEEPEPFAMEAAAEVMRAVAPFEIQII
jgi:pyruvate-formate lyase-activating enzyme